MRKRGFTLVELLLAAAVLAAVVLLAYVFVFQGFSAGSDLARREEADTLSRNSIDYFSKWPLEALDELFGGRPTITLSGNGGPHHQVPFRELVYGGEGRLHRQPSHGFEHHLSYLPAEGELAAALLRSEVSWLIPGGTRRRLVHTRYLTRAADGPGVSTVPGMMRPGFSYREKEDPTWGRATRWTIPVPGATGALPSDLGPGQEDPGESGAGGGSSIFGGELATPEPGDGPGSRARRAQGVHARASIYQATVSGAAMAGPVSPGPERARRELAGLTFRGLDALPPDLLGKGGRLAATVGRPEARARARAEVKRRRFLARTGAQAKPWLQDAIPDGIYHYRLEASDLRTATGDGPVVGVYMLQADPEPFRLVSEVSVSGAEAVHRLEGDLVLEHRVFVGPGDKRWRFARTEGRLYLFRLTDAPLERTVELRTLAASDGSAAGTALTRNRVELFLGGSMPAEAERPVAVVDELAATAAVQAGEAWVTGGGIDPACVSCGPSAGRLAGITVRQVPVVRAPMGGRSASSEAARRAAAPRDGDEAGGAAPGATGTAARASRDLEDAVRLAKDRPAEALAAVERVLDAGGGEATEDARIFRAQLLARLRRFAAAAEALEAVASANPAVRIEVFRDRVGYLLHAGRTDAAERALGALVAREAGDPMVEVFRRSIALQRASGPDFSP